MSVALVLVRQTSAVWSLLSFYGLLFTAIPMGLVLLPQPVRTDKRTIVGVFVLVVMALGAPVLAAPSRICDWAWWAIECWFA